MTTADWALVLSGISLVATAGIGVAQYRLGRAGHRRQAILDTSADLYVVGKKEAVLLDEQYARLSDYTVYVENRGPADATEVNVTHLRRIAADRIEPNEKRDDWQYDPIALIVAGQSYRITAWEAEYPGEEEPFTMTVAWTDGRGRQERTMTVTHFE